MEEHPPQNNVSFAIIYPDNGDFNDPEKWSLISKEMDNWISKYVKIKETNNTNFITDLVCSISNSSKDVPNTEFILELPDRIYKIFYVSEHVEPDKPLNGFGSLLTYDGKRILGPVIILCSMMNQKGSTSVLPTK